MIIQEVLEKVLINQRLVMIGHKSSAYEAAVSMLNNKCGALLVCNSNNNRDLVGIITERDITFKVIPKNLDPKVTEVSKIMTKNVETISPNKTTIDAIQVMRSKGFRHLPVLEKRKILVNVELGLMVMVYNVVILSKKMIYVKHIIIC